MENEPPRRRKERPTLVEQRRKPTPINGEGYWIPARRHPDKGYPEAWRWVQGGEPEIPPDFLALPRTEEEAKLARLDEQSELGRVAAEKWDKAGRPMKGAVDD